MSRRAWGAALLVVLLTLPALWPFGSQGGFWASDDGHLHLYRLFSLAEAWRQGHLYPRLFPDFAFGYGFSVLHFYGPLSYYVALWLHALGLEIVAAMRACFALSYPLAALGAWWLARDLWRGPDDAPNEGAGVVAAAIYSYVPYHVADVQQRGALAESWAFVPWPLLFWAVWRGRFWPLVLALAALILTHNLSVVLVAAPLAAWAGLALWQGEERARQARTLVGAGATALALTAFYWLPVLLESRFVAIAQDVGGAGFAEHLAPLRAWLAAGPRYHYRAGGAADHPLSWAQVALLGGALGAAPLAWRRGPRAPLLFWWGTLGAALFLLTPAARPLWQLLIVPLGLIQYPWRWLGLVALATALVGAAPLRLARRDWRAGAVGGRALRSRLATIAGVGLVGWLAWSSLAHAPWPPRTIEPRDHPVAMWADDAAAGQVGATWTAEFLPRTVAEQRWALARAPETVGHAGAQTALRVRAAGGDGWTLWAEVESASGGRLIFPRFAYPTMAATVDGAGAAVEPQGALGLAGVTLPAGRHRVELRAWPMASRGGLLALLALPPLALIGYGVARRRSRPWMVAALLLVALPLALLASRGQPYAEQPIASDVGEQATLVAARAPAWPLRPGDALPVTLRWFNRVGTADRYSTFVHLSAPGGGEILVADDGEPNEGTVPTPRWLPGQLVEDLHLLRLPDELPPGRYELWGGMYALRDGQAVPIAGDSGERRLLGSITVR